MATYPSNMYPSNTPHPSGLNRAARRQWQQAMQPRAARIDPNRSKHIAALQETRKYWCEDGGENCPGGLYHTEIYCPNCSREEGRPVYELRGRDAAMHPEWRK